MSTAAEPAGDAGWPGRRLGLPPSGAGSVARLGRRVVALVLDWLAAVVVSRAFFDGDPFVTLAVFALVQWLLVGSAGSSPGHRLLGLRVARLDGRPPGLALAAARALLLALALPPLIADRDQRGLHDRAPGTVLLRR